MPRDRFLKGREDSSMVVSNVDSAAGRPVTETVRYRKTEQAYEVRVQATFFSDGSSVYSECDIWDVRDQKFTPCAIERAFAESLRGQPQREELPHLHLDRQLADEAVMKWLTEPEQIAAGITLLNSALRQCSLNRINGEYILGEIAGAVQHGRRLAEEKRSLDAMATKLDDATADVEARINSWVRAVERIFAQSLAWPAPFDDSGRAA